MTYIHGKRVINIKLKFINQLTQKSIHLLDNSKYIRSILLFRFITIVYRSQMTLNNYAYALICYYDHPERDPVQFNKVKKWILKSLDYKNNDLANMNLGKLFLLMDCDENALFYYKKVEKRTIALLYNMATCYVCIREYRLSYQYYLEIKKKYYDILCQEEYENQRIVMLENMVYMAGKLKESSELDRLWVELTQLEEPDMVKIYLAYINGKRDYVVSQWESIYTNWSLQLQDYGCLSFILEQSGVESYYDIFQKYIDEELEEEYWTKEERVLFQRVLDDKEYQEICFREFVIPTSYIDTDGFYYDLV